MKTIEELVAQVAKNTGAASPQLKSQPKQAPAQAPVKTQKPIPQPVEMAWANSVTYAKMTLELAKTAAKAVETAAALTGVKVVTAVCDEGANLVLLHAMDDSYIASIRAAQDKAYTAVALKMPTHTALQQSRGGALDGLTNGNGILLLGGGFPLEANNKIYGGIGVSGGTKDQDMMLSAVAAEIVRILLEKGGSAVK